MPIIKSAKKRMRQEKKRSAINRNKKENLKILVKNVRADKTVSSLTAVFSALDKAAKTGLIHKNKADRLKSRLSKGEGTTKATQKPAPKKKVVTRPASGGKKASKR
jgi:small subunit ribosomal protein S20